MRITARNVLTHCLAALLPAAVLFAFSAREAAVMAVAVLAAAALGRPAYAFLHERRAAGADRAPEDGELAAMARSLGVAEAKAGDMATLCSAVEQSPNSVVITDTQGNIRYVNRRFCLATGYEAAEVIGQNPRLLKSGQTSDEHYRQMWAALSAGREWRGDFHNRRKDGSLFWERAWIAPIRDGDGAITHFIALKEDITDRKSFEEELSHRANYDGLTGLPTRALALERLRDAVRVAERTGRMAAVLLVDIDMLRTVNETMGHDAGDELLRQAAARLQGCLREHDTVARLGGDEFLVVLSEIADPAEADKVAGDINEVLNLPFLIDERDVAPGASIGVAVFPADGDDPVVLLKNADAALYLAKDEGRNGRRFFTPELHLRARQRLEIEAALRQALAYGEFRLYYHPLVEAATGVAAGAEALIRWHSAELGEVAPDQFIPIAEETGLIVAIGEWVIRTACHDMAAWDRQGLPPVRVAVNVSARQLADPRLVEVVAESLVTNGLHADRLEIEVTERVLLGRDGDTRNVLERLKGMGLRISIDDFGTGYSAMSYLTAFSFDVLKIDRSFVSQVLCSRQDAALASAIIAMAHALDMEIVAEGVEQAGQVEFMRRSGVEFLQGYYFAEPLPAERFAALPLLRPKPQLSLRLVGE